jgi:hypothetical protein
MAGSLKVFIYPRAGDGQELRFGPAEFQYGSHKKGAATFIARFIYESYAEGNSILSEMP